MSIHSTANNDRCGVVSTGILPADDTKNPIPEKSKSVDTSEEPRFGEAEVDEVSSPV